MKKEVFSKEAQRHYGKLLKRIERNEIPDKWDYYGMLSTQKTLISFLRVFLSKHEHITQVIVQRNNTLFPSISLYKLFDPFGLIYSLLFDSSKKMNVINSLSYFNISKENKSAFIQFNTLSISYQCWNEFLHLKTKLIQIPIHMLKIKLCKLKRPPVQ